MAPAAPKSATEQARLSTLASLQILDTAPEERFDRVTRIAQRLFDVPSAHITLIDRHRQWFKSSQPSSILETPRDEAFCAYTILEDEMIVSDARDDARFADNPHVLGTPGVRFYAGVAIRSQGHRVGALCIVDTTPRTISPEDFALLRDLALTVEGEINMRTAATIDALTGVVNRTGFLAIGRHCLQVADREDSPLFVLYCDVDNFKTVNDTLGHKAGDEALTRVASVLSGSVRASDVVARLGGDEFCAILRVESETEVLSTVARIHKALAGTSRPGDPARLGLSIGWARYRPGSGVSLEAMLDTADAAMYQSRAERRALSNVE